MTLTSLARPTEATTTALRLAIVDRAFTMQAWTDALASALGADPATVAGASLLARVHPDDQEQLRERLERVRATPAEQATTQVRFRAAGGAWRQDRVTIASMHMVGELEVFVLFIDSSRPTTLDLSERLARASALRTQTGRVRAGRLSLDELSPREREVLELVLDGYRVSTIARSLYLSPSTVRNHLSAIFRKFGVRSQAELVEELHHAELGPPLGPDGAA
ncbi:MAG: LuxR C-terminal-related transcriptional regulator [Acidimicrobiia bacterium]